MFDRGLYFFFFNNDIYFVRFRLYLVSSHFCGYLPVSPCLTDFFFSLLNLSAEVVLVLPCPKALHILRKTLANSGSVYYLQSP